MKKKLILILTSLPFFALGQNDFADGFSTTEIRSEKYQIWKAYTNLDKNIETALIDDTRYYKPVLNFDLDKSDALSLTIKNDNLFLFFDDYKLDEIKPLKDFNWKFR